MKFIHEFFDISPYLRSGVQPSIVIRRNKPNGTERDGLFMYGRANADGKYWVPSGPLHAEAGDPKWCFCNSDDFVAVRFHAYLTPSVSPATIWPVGLEVGMFAIDSLREKTQDVPEIVYLFCGDTVYEKDGKLQALLALAIKVKD